ncbi:MAG: hypothetical protein U0136_05455 [Bdellovibrionota bacterium]
MNRQYSRSEYEDLRARIVAQMKATGEWGQFFPRHLTPFNYNQTVAQEYFPLTEQQVEQFGFRWGKDEVSTAPVNFIAPDHIDDVPDDGSSRILKCANSGASFRLTRQEVEFYRRLRVPLPRLAPIERIRSRLGMFELHEVASVSCAKCGTSVPSAMASSGRPLFCEECYQKEVA